MRDLTAELAAITGAAHVLTEPAAVAAYATDWTRRYTGAASCVVRPGSTAEVAAVLAACAVRQIPVVPQGGNTGLVGGSVPARARPSGHVGSPGRADRNGPLPVIVSAGRLTGLDPVDVAACQVTAGAGVTIGRLAAHAQAAGLRYGVDLASRDSATVGGTIATNAGGIRTIRYGPTRSQLAGLTAVLADGSVISDLSGLTAGSSGYDLAHLLTGSEGTLAVITEARLVLRPAEQVAAVVLAGLDGIEQASALYGALRARVPALLAAEYFDAACLDLVCQATGLPPPLPRPYPAYLLAEIAGSPGKETSLDFRQLEQAGLPADSVVAPDRRGQAALWACRERIAEAIAVAGIPHKIDVAVPAGQLGAFRSALDDAVMAAVGDPAPAGRPGAAPASGAGQPRVLVFGHIGVGNLHVNVLGPGPADTSADEAVARLAADCGGSVAAEHGVGRSKTGWLGWSRSAAEIRAMRAIKSALDPSGLLNPGVLLPA
jgi:FAD/FMN-containing dehydrogenase